MSRVATTMVQTTRTMVRTTLGSRVFGSNPVAFVSSPFSSNATKRAIDELKNVSNQIKEKVATQSKEAVGGTENIAEKAKQSAQEAWDTTKDAAQKVQNTVAEKAEASAGTVKDHVEAAKRSMNTKK